jgi:hypothetical protein
LLGVRNGDDCLSKPLNEFGGWLSFCRFYVILNFIGITIFLALLLIKLIKGAFMHITYSSQIIVLAVIIIFVSVIFVFNLVQILKILKTRSSIISTKISKLFILWLVLNMVTSVIIFVMGYLNILHGSFKIDKFMNNALLNSITTLSWLAYFRWSKRVKAFYGANAFE